jgi:hypothetical protein
MPSSNIGDFDIDDKRHYRVEGGQDSPYGKVSYRVLTNLGSGHGWYQNGTSEDHQMVATGRSVEALGENLKKVKTDVQDPLNCAKLIQAKHGDIVIDALDGDIILKGDNIIIEANGTRDNNDGDVLIQANKQMTLTAPDLRVEATQLKLLASKDFSLVGKAYGEVIGGVLNIVQASDFGTSSLINKISNIATSFLGI